MRPQIFVRHKQTYATARKFLGTLEDAEDVKTWASGTEVSWAPVDENYTDPENEEPDLSKGVSLDVVSHMGYQAAEAGDWLVRDEAGVAVFAEKHFRHYFTEHKEESGAV